MCDNPYMLLSHYEILACGTALWKLLDGVCSGPINTLAFGEWWSVQTTHVTNEREREEGKLTGPWWQGSSLITIFRVIIAAYPFRKRLFLPFWMDDTLHHTALQRQSTALLFLSHTSTSHLIYYSSIVTAHFPDLAHWPKLQYTKWCYSPNNCPQYRWKLKLWFNSN